MRIEVLSEKLKDLIDGQLVILANGDTKTVPDSVGELWCQRGWAKDLDGNVETGERKPGAGGKIEPAKILQKTS